MKTREAPRQTLSTLQGTSKQFSIAATGKAFRTLIDGLYENKIEAPVREIISNASDAHLSGGIDRPFEIFAPTWLDATFAVRDYGHSMDESFILDSYSTLFYSSKDDEDVEVGMFGLGSKSPFAYGDSFSITTFRDGVRTSFLCHIDSEDIPTVTVMSSDKTTEEDGTLVSFPVLQRDINAFEQAIKKMVLPYANKPIVHNLDEYEWPEPIYNDHGITVYARQDVPYLGNSRYLEQGSVLYRLPVEVTYFNDYIPADGRQATIVSLPIGTFDVTPSRDGIALNEETKNSLSSMSRTLYEDVARSFRELYSHCKTRLDFSKAITQSEVFMTDAFTPKYETFNGAVRSYSQLHVIPDHVPFSYRGGGSLHLTLPGYLYRISTRSYSPVASIPAAQLDEIQLYIGMERKVQRLALRMARHYGRHDYYCHTEDAARFIRILGLTPDRVHSVLDLPDVPPPARKRVASTGAKGTTGPKAQAATIGDNFFLPTVRGMVDDSCLYHSWQQKPAWEDVARIIKTYVQIVGEIDPTVAELWKDKEIYSATPSVIALLDPSQNALEWMKSLDMVAIAKHVAETMPAGDSFGARYTKGITDSNMRAFLESAIKEKFKGGNNTLNVSLMLRWIPFRNPHEAAATAMRERHYHRMQKYAKSRPAYQKMTWDAILEFLDSWEPDEN